MLNVLLSAKLLYSASLLLTLFCDSHLYIPCRRDCGVITDRSVGRSLQSTDVLFAAYTHDVSVCMYACFRVFGHNG